MARQPRQRSQSGFYHVMVRGNGRQVIFSNDTDRRAFLHMLRTCLGDNGIELIAWCLMDNHAHLLVSDRDAELTAMMHALETRYARYFNETTGHVGSVFQGRFKSKAIETDAYLLQAVRNIHDNPRDRGYARDAYPWSSYGEYVGTPSIVDPKPVLELIGGRERFAAFSEEGGRDTYTFAIPAKLDDGELMQVAKRLLRGMAPYLVKTLPAKKRLACLQALKQAGLSIRKMERATGLGRNLIQRELAREANSAQ
ncbi:MULTISPECIES: transposase [Enorma]|uniref:transposase n=1 Tax=Enorma TaxID=1472762 RepID=UPI000476C776|nr:MULTISPECIES: transposase [Enorma]